MRRVIKVIARTCDKFDGNSWSPCVPPFMCDCWRRCQTMGVFQRGKFVVDPRDLDWRRACSPITVNSRAQFTDTTTNTRAHRIQHVSRISRKTISARVVAPSPWKNPGMGLFEGSPSRTSYEAQTHLRMVLPLDHLQFFFLLRVAMKTACCQTPTPLRTIS